MRHGSKRQIATTIMSAKGFTIMEVMMVMAIMGVLIMLVTPSVNSMIDKQRVRGTCESIYQTMALARSSTVSLNRNVTFNFRSSNAGATWCVGLYDATVVGGCDCSTSPSTCTVNGIVRSANSTEFDGGSSPSIKVTMGASSDVSVAFSARDAAPDTLPSDILVRSNRWACALRLETLGQVKYLKEGTGTSSRAIVPLAEAGALN